ncbi:MAG: helix-turn-helix domain-containing protein [Varibaculum sp.]
MSYSKNRAIVLAVTEGAMTTSQAATHFNTSPRHIRRLLTQYRQHGLKGLEPKSRKPHHNPNATNQQTINQIIKLRHNECTEPRKLDGYLFSF